VLKCIPVLLFLTGALGFSQEGFSLFLETDPLGARIELNGKLLEQRTPLLLEDLKPGNNKVFLFKEGYESLTVNLQGSAGSISREFFSLPKRYAAVSFPEEDSLYLINQEVSAINRQFRLREGEYTFSFDQENQLVIEPVFPEEGMLQGTTWSLIGTAGISLIMTVQDIGDPWNNKFILSPTTLLSYALLTWNLGYNLTLRNQKRLFYERLEASQEINVSPPALARKLFEEGQRFLAQGELIKALDQFVTIQESFPESGVYPEALFLMARIQNLQGLRAQARASYLLIATHFQTADLFDRAHWALAELAFQEGDRENALKHLDSLVFFDERITPQQAQVFRVQVQDMLQEDL